jgi:transposase
VSARWNWGWSPSWNRLFRRICGRGSGLCGKESHPGAPLGHDGVTTLHQDRERPRIRIQTILNRLEKFKSFVYSDAHIEEQASGPALVIQVLPRKNGRPYCSGCLRRGRPYDHLKERRFEFVPLWGILVFLAYRMRRVDCPRCGVTVELVPWSDGKNRLTTTYRWFLASWARRLSWDEVGAIFRTSWDSVRRAVEHAVEWGLAHRDLSGVTAVGIDEVAWQRGHTYMTLLYDSSAGAKRLLAVAEHRT